MKKIYSAILYVLLLGVSSCEETIVQYHYKLPSFEERSQLNGSWQLFESGYSNGSGYIVEVVAASPLQQMTFHTNGTLSTTVPDLEKFTYYQVLYDPRLDFSILALFENDPGEDEVYDLTQSYAIEFEGAQLKLHDRYCIEGCHLRLEKVSG